MNWIFGAALLCFVFAGAVQVLIWISKMREARRAGREEQQCVQGER